jgi:CheY-like chemotaxis protein
MGGVRVVSGATLGEGDTIINVLRIPELVRLAKDAARSGRQAEPITVRRTARILVVDDSVNTREIERSILEAHGYQVITAGDGEEAFETTRNETFDLIVTDIEMPRLDGFALTRRLRQDERYHAVPIVMVTSLEREEDKRKGVAAGADAYIVKSAFDQSNLLEIIRGLIG